MARIKKKQEILSTPLTEVDSLLEKMSLEESELTFPARMIRALGQYSIYYLGQVGNDNIDWTEFAKRTPNLGIKSLKEVLDLFDALDLSLEKDYSFIPPLEKKDSYNIGEVILFRQYDKSSTKYKRYPGKILRIDDSGENLVYDISYSSFAPKIYVPHNRNLYGKVIVP